MPTQASVQTAGRGANLVPARPQGWDGSLIVTDAAGKTSGTTQRLDRETFVSWGLGNTGDVTVVDTYFVDLYFDDVVVNRWTGISLAAEEIVALVDWPDLGATIVPTPGVHVIKLVVDPTNLIPETNEEDNVYEVEVVWEAGEPVAAPERPVTRLPDLAVSQPRGMSDAIVASPYSTDTDDWQLSVDLPSYVFSGVENRGLSSIDRPVRVDLYLDEVLVAWRTENGMIAGGSPSRVTWSGIGRFVPLTPGEHTLKVVVDPTNIIEESDETNNELEKVFTWGAGEVQARPAPTVLPSTTLPEPLTLSNLQPGWAFDSDGPISIFHRGDDAHNPPLVVGQDVLLRVAVKNGSSVGTRIPFAVDIHFDDKLVNSMVLRGAPENAIVISDWDGLVGEVDITPGDHTVRIVIDSRNSVREADEEDNVFEHTFTWLEEPPPEPVALSYSEQQIGDMLSGLRELVDSREIAVSADGKDHSERIIEVVDAGYHLMTGETLQDDRVDIHILNRTDYRNWLDEAFANQFASANARQMPGIHVRYERLKEYSVGVTSRERGRVVVVINGERPIPLVIDTLAHEVGHLRQDLINPDQHNAATFDPSVLALLEAQAQQFQRAFWLTIEDFTGERLTNYPDMEAFERIIAQQAFSMFRTAEQDEHALGYLLQWAFILTVPELEPLADELERDGSLSAESSLKLYNYLVELSPQEAAALVRGTYGQISADDLAQLYNRMVSVASDRLVSELHPDDEGVPTLRTVGLLTP